MDTVLLKKYIYENEKVDYVLDKIGCYHIEYHANKNYWSCANYNGDNTGAINVSNNEYLNVHNWTREKYFNSNSDIITLIEYSKNVSFIQAVKYLHDILGIEYKRFKPKKKEEKDALSVFKKIKESSCYSSDINDIKEIYYDSDNYYNLLHINWIKEGITYKTAKKFGIAYSFRRNRIIIPMKYWLNGSVLGINSRTTVDNYKELGIKKYFITPSYQKGLNLYGLYENYNSIKKAGYVVVYESEKSVLRRDSLFDETGVAISGHVISDEQARILIGLDVDIIISMDNDIDINEVRSLCEKFYGIRNVYYTFDKYKLLGNKDSIADGNNKKFKYLFEHKQRYDLFEHNKYIESLGVK